MQMPSKIRKRMRRRGALVPMFAVVIIVLLAAALFSVDIAYIQLSCTQLRSAVDNSAKAAATALADGATATQAKAIAIEVASKNNVGGRQLPIDASQIELGSLKPQNDGRWKFIPNGSPLVAARIDVRMQENESGGPLNLFFGRVFGVNQFRPSSTATAGNLQTDIVLAYDRSHSMCFDCSGVEWEYPPGVPAPFASMKTPPSNTGTRWQSLMRATDTFLKEVDANSVPPRIGLVSWASTVSTSSFEYALTGVTSPDVTYESPVGATSTEIRNKLQAKSTVPMLGATNMSAGLQAAMNHLLAADDKKPRWRMIILFSDGEWNQGSDPVTLIPALKAANIQVHTIRMLVDPKTTAMQDIAEGTGGKLFVTNNDAEMAAAFREIAGTLPVALIE
jgi:Ca-activated chloride channel family protein